MGLEDTPSPEGTHDREEEGTPMWAVGRQEGGCFRQRAAAGEVGQWPWIGIVDRRMRKPFGRVCSVFGFSLSL